MHTAEHDAARRNSGAIAAQPTPVAPDTFAYRSRIELSGPGPFHQLTLPLAVYPDLYPQVGKTLQFPPFQGEG